MCCAKVLNMTHDIDVREWIASKLCLRCATVQRKIARILIFNLSWVVDNEDPQCTDWDRSIYCQDNEDFDDKETSYEDSDATKGAPNFMLTGRR